MLIDFTVSILTAVHLILNFHQFSNPGNLSYIHLSHNDYNMSVGYDFLFIIGKHVSKSYHLRFFFINLIVIRLPKAFSS